MSPRRVVLTIVVAVLLGASPALGQADLDGDGLYDLEDYAIDQGIDLTDPASASLPF